MPLNDTRIRALKPSVKPTKHGDSGGLLLVVNPTGSKLWRMVYRFEGKQKQLSFGTWPDVSLAEARAARDTANFWGQWTRIQVSRVIAKLRQGPQ